MVFFRWKSENDQAIVAGRARSQRRLGARFRRRLNVAATIAAATAVAGVLTLSSSAQWLLWVSPWQSKSSLGLRPGALRQGSERCESVRAAFPTSLSPKQAKELGIETPMPFGDGGADLECPRPKVYTHGPCRSPVASKFIVPAGHLRSAAPGSPETLEVAAQALE
ncbi:unnamed protein product, partial [Polarella glacialis]